MRKNDCCQFQIFHLIFCPVDDSGQIVLVAAVKVEDDLPVSVCIQSFNHLVSVALILGIYINPLLMESFTDIHHRILFLQNLLKRLFLH